jgi:hypothetical protein
MQPGAPWWRGSEIDRIAMTRVHITPRKKANRGTTGSSREDEMASRWGGAVSGRRWSLRDLREAQAKLPPEGQKWIDGMDRSELEGTQDALHRLGEQGFIEHWRSLKEQLDEFRHFFGGQGEKAGKSPL